MGKRLAYFDCFSGISGDMILAALIDAGVSLPLLRKELKKLGIKGYKLSTQSVSRGHLSGLKFHVKTETKKYLSPQQMLSTIEKSSLEPDIKSSTSKILTRLIQAETKVHQKDPQSLHLHKIGEIDTIIDIAGAVIAIKLAGIETIYSSPLNIGGANTSGMNWVELEGVGTLPIPAPATVELIKGIPVYCSGINTELVTPTGAAIITTLTENFQELPPMTIQEVGYGAGAADLEIPNFLRIFIGVANYSYPSDRVTLIETNIDDTTPEIAGYLMEKLFELGALDVYFTPVYMKKNRPGIILSLLVEPEKVEEIMAVIFKETPTLGLRIQEIKRIKLLRKTKEITTKYGSLRIKIAYLGDYEKIIPEYEDCKKIAAKLNLPLHEVYNESIKVGSSHSDSVNKGKGER